MIRLTPLARKALRLKGDGVFRLLVIMTALLGWVVALGVGGTVLMNGVYQTWRLERMHGLQVYLQPDVETQAVQALQVELSRLPGVISVQPVPAEVLRETLASYGGDVQGVPLPQVLDIRTGREFDRTLLDPVVQGPFPTAEIDDAQPVLQAVARGVRLVQIVGLGLAVLMALIMGMMVALTVRAGLRAQRETLDLLQHLGATYGLVQTLVSRVVVRRVMLGWALASGAAVSVMGGVLVLWPALHIYMGWGVWAGLVLGPLVLPMVAWGMAMIVARRLVHSRTGEAT